MAHRTALAALVVSALAWPASPRAHGVSQQVERRGETYAVRARYEGGKPLAGATYQVLRPGAAETVAREGRTGVDGWVEFVPDVTGTWRVRIADATGHGRVVAVEVPEVAPASPPAAAAVPAASPAPAPATRAPSPAEPPSDHGERTLAQRALGAAGILGVFAVLWVLRRRRRAAR
ncbi:MAG TPA: hypothetical protein VF894_13200 [Anaeromyxobacter sp.]